MRTKKWTKEKLIELFKMVSKKLGRQPLQKEWNVIPETPSDMPVRCLFKTWNNFVLAAGGTPKQPQLSTLARENSAKAHRGKRFNWKGGRIQDRWGYIQIWAPDHPNCKSAGYIHEHRLIMSQMLERPLKKNESVHHKNGIRNDNRPENLELWTTNQPPGQRVEDKIEWCIQFLSEYGICVDWENSQSKTVFKKDNHP